MNNQSLTPDDYERAILKHPHSSYAYVSYCEYFLRQN